ncbi:hypothetical protein ACFLZW_05685 [Chloroflexota bacterium]
MNRPFCVNYETPGTLAANDTFEFKMPVPAILYRVSAVASNDSDATIMIGTAADTDAYMAATTIGDSGVPNQLDRDDFIDDQYPHIPADTNVVITLDYDGAAGTAADDFELLVTFLAD